MTQQQPPHELIEWLDEIREKGIALPAVGPDAPKSYIIRGTRHVGAYKEWRAMDAYQAEHDAETLWKQGRWASIAINGVVRYSLEGGA